MPETIKTKIRDISYRLGEIKYYYRCKLNAILLPQAAYHIRRFRQKTGRKPDLKNPATFNEKLLWLLIYWYSPQAVRCADKYRVREYVEQRCGKEILVPLYGLYESVEEIDYDALPPEFVLKATHGSGWNLFCTDKNAFDRKRAADKMNRWLKRNYYYYSREWVYREIPPRIICEKLLIDENGNVPDDYKIFCFNGIPRIIQVDSDRFSRHTRNLYDTGWNFLDYAIDVPNDKNKIKEKPARLSRMLEIAAELANGFPQVRIDLYYTDNQIYFGEMTFFHGGGTEEFFPEEFGRTMGDYLTLPRQKNKLWKK